MEKEKLFFDLLVICEGHHRCHHRSIHCAHKQKSTNEMQLTVGCALVPLSPAPHTAFTHVHQTTSWLALVGAGCCCCQCFSSFHISFCVRRIFSSAHNELVSVNICFWSCQSFHRMLFFRRLIYSLRQLLLRCVLYVRNRTNDWISSYIVQRLLS